MRLQYFPREPRWKTDAMPAWEFGCWCGVVVLVLSLASWGLR